MGSIISGTRVPLINENIQYSKHFSALPEGFHGVLGVGCVLDLHLQVHQLQANVFTLGPNPQNISFYIFINESIVLCMYFKK